MGIVTSRINMVEGNPNFKNSKNPTVLGIPLSRALSTTMMTAADPRMVRFPDMVDTHAKRYHARSAFVVTLVSIAGDAIKTAGTFEMVLDKRVIAVENVKILNFEGKWSGSKSRSNANCGIFPFMRAATTTKRPPKKQSSL